MLRGLGTGIALPLLDAMLPTGGLARAAEAVAGGAAGGPLSAPRRLAMFFVPNGMIMDDWTPAQTGTAFELPPTLQPLAALKDELTVLSGLALDNARSKGDGPGDHARSAAAFLTGAHPYKTKGSDIKLGVSVDQVAAEKIGGQTRLPSLQIGLERGAMAGECDSGYSCAYVSNLSWRSETTPLPNEVDPSALFERLFGSAEDRAAAESRAKRLLYRKSVLDFVADDARRLGARLGKNDQRKLDEYTTAVREIEKRVERDREEQAQLKLPEMERPEGVPDDMTEHMKLMCDLLALAFQTDMTRVATFMVAPEGSNRTYRWLDVGEGHHSLSHHGRSQEKMDQIRRIDRYHAQQFAYFVQKLKDMKEADGRSVLDNSMVLFGSGISDGNRHNHDDLPILLAGRGGGSVTPGRHVRYEDKTPLCNLYVSLLERVGAPVERFGDSTGPLGDLAA